MRIEKEIYPYFPETILTLLRNATEEYLNSVIEIRLRAGRPVLLVSLLKEGFLAKNGGITRECCEAYVCSKKELDQILQAMSKHSLYALGQELRQGYLTLDGGHRVGLAGKTAVEKDGLRAIQEIGSLNIRIAHEAKGCANSVMPYIRGKDGLCNVLIIAPPRAGKTTLLRDIARCLSNGDARHHGIQVSIVDERSEIAASIHGCPTVDVGIRTDVLDACPKDIGILMMIRSMAPQVIITDELGRREDALALEEALHAGVRMIASLHGASVEDAQRRPYIGGLIDRKYFDRYILLSTQPSIGSIQAIIDAKSETILFARDGGRTLCG